MLKIILHCDINNFYASVAIALDPNLKNKAVAVCGDPTKRHGIILAKSLLAKQAGVVTGETIWQAQRKCKNLILVLPRFDKYQEYSRKIRDIYYSYTPLVEDFGLDECWLDVTGCIGSEPDGGTLARKIADEVKYKTGITISVGASFTKTFAKLGSDMKKPDGVTVISKQNYKTVAWNQPAQNMLYVGNNTQSELNKYGIFTIGDIANAGLDFLESKFGKRGRALYLAATGEDDSTVSAYITKERPKSIGNGMTTAEDIKNSDDAKSVIYALSDMIAFRLRRNNLIASGICLQLKDMYFFIRTKQEALKFSTANAQEIAQKAFEILNSIYDFKTQPPLRSITITTYKLTDEANGIQTSMFLPIQEKNERLNKAVDVLREKYGYDVLKRGITISGLFNADSLEKHDE
ncbi:MAG: DNA polymerase IV [Christensenellaceae bacterium]|jgi:DNA polymerase-4|nr:DNA polymerase IV [Christensenellaceae bacterium]